MKNEILATAILVLGLVGMATFATAQESQVIHFQGMLTGPGGGPLRTDIYDVNFSIWNQASGGVEPEWSEMQVVEVTDGLFDVFLGSQIRLSADVFTYAEGESDLRFLEIQVVGDDPMTPRTQIAKTPNSFVSSRVVGDIQTGEGFIRMSIPPDPMHPVAEIMSDDIANITSFRMSIPPDPVNPVIEMSADPVQSSFKLIDPVDKREGFVALTDVSGSSMKLMDPDDEELVGLEMIVDANGNSFKLMDPGDDGVPSFDFLADGMNNIHSFKLMDPGDDGLEVPAIEMTADLSGSSFKVNLMEPPVEKPGVEIMTSNTGPAGSQASFRMFNPQPEPPATDPVIEIKTMPNDAGYFAMNNLSGAEVGPLLEMTTDPTASSRILIHAAQPTFSGRVEIQAQYTDGANMTMFREGPELHNEIKAMDLRVGSDIGGEFNIFNYSSNVEQELLSISGSPSAGGSFRMFNPQPEPPAQPLLEMNSTQFGANFAMAAPQAGGLRNEITDPMFEVNVVAEGATLNMNDEIGKYMGLEPMPFTPGGRFQMIDPVADAVKFEVETTEDGASISLSDEIGKYMGVEPVPFMPGGAFYMDDPSTDQTNVWIESSGRVSARKGIFGQNITGDGNYSLATGDQNIIAGNNSFAGGRVAQANHDNCFVWSDYPFGPSVQPTQTSADNQFLVRATGGVAFYTNGGFSYGVSLGPDDYTWNSILPPLTAHNSRDVDSFDILNKIQQLPIRQFTAETENNQTKHISPVPEDFNRIFGIGADDNQLSMLDPSGVALAGVKALLERIEQLEARIAELEAERR